MSNDDGPNPPLSHPTPDVPALMGNEQAMFDIRGWLTTYNQHNRLCLERILQVESFTVVVQITASDRRGLFHRHLYLAAVDSPTFTTNFNPPRACRGPYPLTNEKWDVVFDFDPDHFLGAIRATLACYRREVISEIERCQGVAKDLITKAEENIKITEQIDEFLRSTGDAS